MAEYIEREAVKQKYLCCGYLPEMSEKEFDEFPTADVAPVVRCKDCTKFEQNGKYYNGKPFGYCYHWDYEQGSSPNEVDGDDFCSYGERREDA